MRKARTFDSFARQIFPGDAVDFVPNSDDLPGDVVTVLEKISKDTEIPYDWLEKTAGLVVDGLAGLQCLWFLHGLSGTVSDTDVTWKWKISAHPYDVLTMSFHRAWPSCMRPGSNFEWQYGILTDLAAGSALMFFYRSDFPKYLQTQLEAALNRESDRRTAKLRSRNPDVEERFLKYDWDAGTVTEIGIDSGAEHRTERLGKLLSKLDLGLYAEEMRHSFETRLRETEPSGRLTLRPYAPLGATKLAIASGQTTYGSGPTLSPAKLTSMFREAGYDLDVREVSLCREGESARVLSHKVYCDVTHRGCEQRESIYKKAYGNLRNRPWPPPALELEEGLRLAEGYVGDISCDNAPLGNEVDINGWAEWYDNAYQIRNFTVDDLIDLMIDKDMNQRHEFENDVMEHFNLSYGSDDGNTEELSEALGESFMLIQGIASNALEAELDNSRVYFLAYSEQRNPEIIEDFNEAKSAAIVLEFSKSRYRRLADAALPFLGLRSSEEGFGSNVVFGPEDPRQLELDLNLEEVPCPLAFLILVDDRHDVKWESLCEEYEEGVPPLVSQATRIAHFEKATDYDVKHAVIQSIWEYASAG